MNVIMHLLIDVPKARNLSEAAQRAATIKYVGTMATTPKIIGVVVDQAVIITDERREAARKALRDVYSLNCEDDDMTEFLLAFGEYSEITTEEFYDRYGRDVP